MKTLLEFLDEHFMDSPVQVYTPDGRLVGEVPPGDESALSSVRDYANGEVVREVQTPTHWAAYVKAKPLPQSKPPVQMGYPGELSDEAAFSLDWRSREPKASEKQLAFIAKNYRLYMTIRKDSWPTDPKLLLRYEASDAMTEMLSVLRRAESQGRGEGE